VCWVKLVMGLLRILWEIPHTPQELLKAVQLIVRLLLKLVIRTLHQRLPMVMVVGVLPPLKNLGISLLPHGAAQMVIVPEQLQLKWVTILTQQGQHLEGRHGNLQQQKLEIHIIGPVALQNDTRYKNYKTSLI